MDDTIRDIGRPRVRSSRPKPPSDAEREWAERMAREDLAEEEEKGAESARQEKPSRH